MGCSREEAYDRDYEEENTKRQEKAESLGIPVSLGTDLDRLICWFDGMDTMIPYLYYKNIKETVDDLRKWRIG